MEDDVKRALKMSQNLSKIYEKHTYKMTSKKVGKIMESNESLKGLTTPKCRKGYQFLCFAEGACGREGRSKNIENEARNYSKINRNWMPSTGKEKYAKKKENGAPTEGKRVSKIEQILLKRGPKTKAEK